MACGFGRRVHDGLGGTDVGDRTGEQRDHISAPHRKQRARAGGGYRFSNPAPSEVLPPARLYLLKVPSFLPTSPLTGDQVFKYMSLSGTFLIQTTRAIGVDGPAGDSFVCSLRIC